MSKNELKLKLKLLRQLKSLHMSVMSVSKIII